LAHNVPSWSSRRIISERSSRASKLFFLLGAADYAFGSNPPYELNKLGVGEASTHLGALENLAMQITKTGDAVAGAMTEAGATIAEAMSSKD
jgi:hypothetical protein